uniref:Ig-like domain-containing protein n=1 Tax=Timema bartmani TaxID=61472 RepID=A0A7R9EYY7_9NEOP|nr:unnamed protein product [Timema bartmani]
MSQVAVPPWPQSISWYNKEGRVDQNDKYHVMEDGLGGYNLEIHPCEVVDEGEWKCVATSALGMKGISRCKVWRHLSTSLFEKPTQSCKQKRTWMTTPFFLLGSFEKEMSLDIPLRDPKNYRRPRFLESLKAILTEEGLVSFECKVVGYPTPQLRWFKDGQELKPGDVYQLTGTNSLGSYSCIAKNCMGETTSSAELTVEDIQNQLNEEEKLQLFSTNQPPKFVRGLKSSEAKIDEDFRFTVQVSVMPEPQVSWYRDDETVESADRYMTSREPLGTYHLDIRRLEMVDQAEWKCVATNDFGHSVTSCFLKLTIPRHFKKPRFLECLQAVLSEEGAVNLECKVIGVPQPVLKWYKDGEELKPGDIHRIISGQDGTCCLGTYTCEAQNCMGVVSSSASLLGFEERRTRKSSDLPKLDVSGGGVTPGGHTIVRNPSLSTIHEERTSQMYDTPATERSLTVDERADISFSFDGREVSVSLYETPDLTEEEALQVVEMYADELSENVSEHNIVELPPLRFVKETSNTRNLLMEAVIIDVTPDYFSSADDDLRTDADLEEFSITDENGHQFSPDVEDDALVFEKINSELRERPLAPPKRPPRRKNEANRQKYDEQMNHDSDTFHSISLAKEASERHSPKEDTDKSEHFTDAVGETSDSQSIADTFMSAKESPGAHKTKKEEFAYKIAIIEENKEKSSGELQTTKSSPAELVRNITIETVNDKHKPDKLDEQQPGNDISKINENKEEVKTLEEVKANTLSNLEATPKPTKKKRKSQDVVKNESLIGTKDENIDGDIGSLRKESLSRTIKKSKSTEKSDQEPQDAIGPKSNEAMAQDYPQKIVLSLGIECPADKTKSTESLKSKESSVEKDNSYSEEGDGLKTFNKRKEKSSKKRKGSVGEGVETNKARKRSGIKKAPPIETDENKMEVEQTLTAAKTGDSKLLKRKDSKRKPSLDSHEQKVARDDGVATAEEESHIKKRKESKRSPSVESNKNKLYIDETTSLAKAEENSKNTLAVDSSKQTEPDQRAICDNTGESPKETKQDTSKTRKTKKQRTISATEAELPKLTALGIGDKVEVDTMAAKTEPTLLESLTQSLLDIQRSLVSVEEKIISQSTNEPHTVMSSLSVLETLTQPIQDSIALVEEQAALESSSEEHSLGKTSTAILETISQPMQEFQRGLALVEKQAAFEESKASLLETTSLSILENVAQPVQELKREIAFIQEQAALHQAESGISKNMIIPSFEAKLLQEKESADTNNLLNISFLECVINPLSELQKEIEILKEQAVMETNREFIAEKPSTTVLVALSKPLLELQKGISLIAQQAEHETLDSPESKNISKNTLTALTQPLEELNKNVRFIEQQASLETEDIEQQIAIESASTFESSNVNPKFVKSLAQSIKELECNIATIGKQKQSENNSSTKPNEVTEIQELKEPLLELKEGLVKIMQDIILEENLERGYETPTSGLITLVQPLGSGVKAESTMSNISLLAHLTEPLKDLTKEIMDVERHKISLSNDESMEADFSVYKLEAFIKPIQKLQQGISLVQVSISEISGKLSPETIALSTLIESLNHLQEQLKKIGDKINNSVLVVRASQPVINSFTNSISELQKGFELIERQAFLDSDEEPMSERESLSILEALAHPLEKLRNSLVQIEEHRVEEGLDGIDNVALKFVTKVTPSVEEVLKGISLIEKQAALESDNLSDVASNSEEFGIRGSEKELKTLIDASNQSMHGKELSSQKYVDKPNFNESNLEGNKHIVDEDIINNELGETGHDNNNMDMTKTKKKKVVNHEEKEKIIVDCKNNTAKEDEQGTEEKAANLGAQLVVYEIETKNNNEAQKEIRYEANDEIIVGKNILSDIETLAKPVKELMNSIYVIEKQIGLESSEPLLGQSNISALQTLTQPLEEIQSGRGSIEGNI